MTQGRKDIFPAFAAQAAHKDNLALFQAGRLQPFSLFVNMTGFQQAGNGLPAQRQLVTNLFQVCHLLQNRGRQLAIGNGQYRGAGAVCADLPVPGLICLPAIGIQFVFQDEGRLLSLSGDQQRLTGLGSSLGTGLENGCLCGTLQHLNQSKALLPADTDDPILDGNQAAVRLNLEQLPLFQRFIQRRQNTTLLQIGAGLAALRRAGGLQANLGICLYMNMFAAIGNEGQSLRTRTEAVVTLYGQPGLGSLYGLIRADNLPATPGSFHLNFPRETLRVDFLRLHFLGAAAKQHHRERQQERQHSSKHLHVSSPFMVSRFLKFGPARTKTGTCTLCS